MKRKREIHSKTEGEREVGRDEEREREKGGGVA